MPYFDKVEEFFVLDTHVLDWVEWRYSLGEPALHFQHALPDSFPSLVLSQILWQEYSNMTDHFNCRQQYWDHKWIAFEAWWTRQNATRGWRGDISVLGKGGPSLTVQENVKNILFVRRDLVDLEF